MENTEHSPTPGESPRKETKCESSIIDIPLIPEPARWPECCIYRVPNKIRKINEEAYTPKLVSIGPFHHGLQELAGVSKQKLIYLKEFCSRTGKNQKDLASIVEKREEKIKHCYSETNFEIKEVRFNFEEKILLDDVLNFEIKKVGFNFVEKILLDAVFIIELLLRNFERKNCGNCGKYGNDYILSNAWIESHIKQDLILLENQLPFMFLKKFYKVAFNGGEDQPPLLKLACEFFFTGKYRIPMDGEVKHFTDLHRMFYCPTHPKDGPKKRIDHLRYTATRLDEAGLEFKAFEDKDLGDRSLLDIEFSKNKCLERYPCLNLSWLFSCLPYLRSFRCFKSVQCVLKVPQLVIDDQTEALFRNLMALEQCHYPSNTYICNYVLLMDCLITTKSDVCLLVEKKVIVNRRGSSTEVTTLINKLGHMIVEPESCYHDLYTRLNDHCDNHWNRLVASLTSVYFRDFWRGTATIAGILVLFFTFGNFLRPFVMKH